MTITPAVCAIAFNFNKNRIFYATKPPIHFTRLPFLILSFQRKKILNLKSTSSELLFQIVQLYKNAIGRIALDIEGTINLARKKNHPYLSTD